MYEELFERKMEDLNIKKVNQTKNFISITLSKEMTKNVDGETVQVASQVIQI